MIFHCASVLFKVKFEPWVFVHQYMFISICSSVYVHQYMFISICSSVYVHQYTFISIRSSVYVHQYTFISICSSVYVHQLNRRIQDIWTDKLTGWNLYTLFGQRGQRIRYYEGVHTRPWNLASNSSCFLGSSPPRFT